MSYFLLINILLWNLQTIQNKEIQYSIIIHNLQIKVNIVLEKLV